MIRKSVALVAAPILAAVLPGCDRTDVPTVKDADDLPRITVRIAAAASLGSVLGQLQPLAHDEISVDVELELGSSGTITQQVIGGTPADLVISAHPKWLDELERHRRLLPGSRIELVHNRIVVISGEGVASPLALRNLPNVRGLIAIGEPTSVPAGMYAEAALRTAGVWEELVPRLLPAVDVRAALAYVERGDAEYGIVYRTDAAATNRVSVAFVVDSGLHEAIVYPAAVTRYARDVNAAERTLRWLTGPTASAVFAAAGFELPADTVAGAPSE